MRAEVVTPWEARKAIRNLAFVNADDANAMNTSDVTTEMFWSLEFLGARRVFVGPD